MPRNSVKRKRKCSTRCRLNAKRYASKRRKSRKLKDTNEVLRLSQREIFSLQRFQQDCMNQLWMSVIDEVEELSSQSGKSSRERSSGELVFDRSFEEAMNRDANAPQRKNNIIIGEVEIEQ